MILDNTPGWVNYTLRHCPLWDEKMTTSDDESQASHYKLQYESELLLFPNHVPNGGSEGLEATVLSSMKSDEIARAVKSDKLILYGRQLFAGEWKCIKSQLHFSENAIPWKALIGTKDRNSDDSSNYSRNSD